MHKKIPTSGSIIGSIAAGISSFFLLLFGISGAMFSLTGICLFCVLPVLTIFLSIFGLSISFIRDYNVYFLIFGILMSTISILLIIYRKKLSCKNGFCKVNFKKTNIKENKK